MKSRDVGARSYELLSTRYDRLVHTFIDENGNVSEYNHLDLLYDELNLNLTGSYMVCFNGDKFAFAYELNEYEANIGEEFSKLFEETHSSRDLKYIVIFDNEYEFVEDKRDNSLYGNVNQMMMDKGYSSLRFSPRVNSDSYDLLFYEELLSKDNLGSESWYNLWTVAYTGNSLRVNANYNKLKQYPYFDDYLNKFTNDIENSLFQLEVRNVDNPIDKLYEITNRNIEDFDFTKLSYKGFKEIELCDTGKTDEDFFSSYDELMDYYETQKACESEY